MNLAELPTDHLIDDLPAQDAAMDEVRRRLGGLPRYRMNVTSDGMMMIFEQSKYNTFSDTFEKAVRKACEGLPLAVERETYRPPGVNLVLWDLIRVKYTGKI
jgi:hypothetical protein